MTTIDQGKYCVDFAWLILIWIVQLIIYPSFLQCRQEGFVAWHNRYTGLISLFVAPLMFGQTAIYFWLCYDIGRWHDYANAVFVVTMWLCTMVLSVPCHTRLHQHGYNPHAIHQLVLSNWPRTIGWTSIVAIDCYVLFF